MSPERRLAVGLLDFVWCCGALEAEDFIRVNDWWLGSHALLPVGHFESTMVER
jgi:hypothetical protein